MGVRFEQRIDKKLLNRLKKEKEPDSFMLGYMMGALRACFEKLDEAATEDSEVGALIIMSALMRMCADTWSKFQDGQ